MLQVLEFQGERARRQADLGPVNSDDRRPPDMRPDRLLNGGDSDLSGLRSRQDIAEDVDGLARSLRDQGASLFASARERPGVCGPGPLRPDRWCM